MGWLWTHKPRGMTATEYLIHNSGALSWRDSPYDYKVLDSAIVNLRTFYAAVEQVHRETKERHVWAAVFLLGYAPKSEHNFGYKGMDETCGPCEAQCPARILDLLTETEYQYAKDWRERCRAYHAANKARPKLVLGAKLKLYGKPYTLVSKYGPRAFLLTGADGTVYKASMQKLRAATDVVLPAP